MAVKGVIATVEDPEMEEAVTVHVDRLAFSSPGLREELESSVSIDPPFRSSVPALHDFFGESPLEPSTFPPPTPLHAPTPTHGSVDFLYQPRAQGKPSVRRNLDPDYSYILFSRTHMATPDYSGARHDDIRRHQGRRVKGHPPGVYLNLY